MKDSDSGCPDFEFFRAREVFLSAEHSRKTLHPLCKSLVVGTPGQSNPGYPALECIASLTILPSLRTSRLYHCGIDISSRSAKDLLISVLDLSGVW